MRFPSRVLARPATGAAAIALALAALAPAQLALVFARSGGVAPVASSAVRDAVVHDPFALPGEAAAAGTSASGARASHPSAAARGGARTSLDAFRGLGTWVDLYDLPFLDPTRAVAQMRARGVQTLFLQTARYNTKPQVDPSAGAWLRAAHAAGIAVVGWYLPGYTSMRVDVARTIAIARYRSGTERFDALGVDIEVKTGRNWNAKVAQQLARARSALPGYPIAAIVPPPLQMDVAPHRWAGFPWAAIGRSSDVVMLMAYWSFRSDCATVPLHCAYGYTRVSVERARALTGLPVNVIGGVGDAVTVPEISDFVRGSHDAGAIGASIYDFRTTTSLFWRLLQAVRTL